MLCAYVGLFADRHPEATTTYGDLEPGLHRHPDAARGSACPRHRPPCRRRAPRGGARVRRHHAGTASRPPSSASTWSPRCSTTPASTTCSVTGRTKSVASFAAKAARTIDGEPLYPDPLTEITDQIGVRVITYVHSDVDAVAELLDDEVVVLDDRDMGQETAQRGRFGYASRHLLIGRDPTRRRPARCAGAACRCRSARCCSTRGPSSSTTSATRARCPRSTCPTSTAGSPSPPGCSSSPTGSSPPSATRLRAGDARTEPEPDRRGPAHRRPGAGGVPRRPVRRCRLVAHRPLRLDRRAAARARHHLARRAGRGARAGRHRRDQRADGLQAPGRRRPPARRRPARDFGERYVALHGNAHRGDLLRARLARMRGWRRQEPSVSGCRCSRVASSRRSASLAVRLSARALAAAASASRPSTVSSSARVAWKRW